MKRWLVPAVWLLLSSIPFPAQTAEVDSYGGWTLVQGTKTGFFHTEKIDGRWWLVTPDGNAFFSKGVCHISFEGDHSPKLGYSPYEKAVQAKYGSEGKWAEATALRLKEWNFNTVSAWSSSSMFETGLAYTVILALTLPGAQLFYLAYGGIEIVLTLLITLTALRWPRRAAETLEE